ncbi:ferritin-like catalase Nec2 [Nicotiana tabacum]|uniref:Ferritin-like catalase Nec2 n=1 Tax=Nicotiana tabacum TaxID=4097 RepID=A0AC58UH03_TOBAC
MAFVSAFVISMVFSELVFVCQSNPVCQPIYPKYEIPVYKEDRDNVHFAQNLEFLEAEYFLWASKGHGIDVMAPYLTKGGPPPIGAQKANLDSLTYRIIEEFAYQEIGHLRAIDKTVGGIPRPLMDLSRENFAKLFDEAIGYELEPPFDPYRDSLSYMLSCYVIPYVGMNGYVGMNPQLKGYAAKHLVAGLLGVEAGQDAVIRMYLYERADEVVWPYEYTVAYFTDRISNLRNRLGMCGIKDEGIYVPLELGAENRTESNVLSADYYSLSYPRTPQEILRIVHSTGSEHMPGGFYPHGANGRIARELLQDP